MESRHNAGVRGRGGVVGVVLVIKDHAIAVPVGYGAGLLRTKVFEREQIPWREGRKRLHVRFRRESNGVFGADGPVGPMDRMEPEDRVLYVRKYGRKMLRLKRGNGTAVGVGVLPRRVLVTVGTGCVEGFDGGGTPAVGQELACVGTDGRQRPLFCHTGPDSLQFQCDELLCGLIGDFLSGVPRERESFSGRSMNSRDQKDGTAAMGTKIPENGRLGHGGSDVLHYVSPVGKGQEGFRSVKNSGRRL